MLGGGEREITALRDGGRVPGIQLDGGCFFVSFGNRGQTRWGIAGRSRQALMLAYLAGEAGVPRPSGVELEIQAISRSQEAILEGILLC